MKVGKYILLIIVAFIAVTIYFLFFTTKGLQTTLDLIPGLSYSKAEGSISKQVHIDELRFVNNRFNIQIDTLTLEWSISSLIRSTVNIEHLNMNNVVITKQSSTSQTTRNSSHAAPVLSLPIHFIIHQSEIKDITINGFDKPIMIDDIVLSSEGEDQQIDLKQFSMTGSIGHIKASGQIDLSQPLNSNLALNSELSLPSGLTINTKSDMNDSNYALSFNLPKTVNGSANLTTTNKGTIQLENGKVNIIPLGVHIDKMTATLQQTNDVITVYGSLQSGKGSAKFSGSHSLNSFNSELTLNGNNLTVFNTPEYQIFASPKLNAAINGLNIDISGSIDIPKAIITPKDFSSTATLPKDVVLSTDKKKKQETTATAWQLNLDTKVTSKMIKVTFRGLDALIHGQLHIKHQPGSPTTSQGKLVIASGKYKAYGQSLTITEGGSLNFTDSPTNPELNLEASKNINMDGMSLTDIPTYQRDLIVGIQTTGTLESPMITLFSSPSGYSQQDILSYLVFGLSQEQLSSSQSTLIWQAVNTLHTGSGSVGDIKEQVQHSLGLSEIGFSSATEYDPDTQSQETGTTFVVGKKINDKLSLTYSMGIVVPVNILYIKYQLSQSWALQTDSSTYGNGADILFSFSKD